MRRPALLLTLLLLAGCAPIEKQWLVWRAEFQRITAPRAPKPDPATAAPPPPADPGYISAENALAIGRARDPDADWSAGLAESLTAELDGHPIDGPTWMVAATYPDGRMQVLYVDARSGEVLAAVAVPAEPSDPPDTPDGAVRLFYALTARGDYHAAWHLLHPRAREPNPATAPGYMLAKFYSRQGEPGPELKEISAPQPMNDLWKFYGCMCQFDNARAVQVKLSDGTERVVHVAQDAHGHWRLFWDPDQGLA